MTKQSIRKWGKSILLAALVALLTIGLAYTVPADLALLAAIDMATYADALIGVAILASVARIRPIILVLHAKARGLARRARPRSRALRKPVRKSADNDDHPAWARVA